jgi:hypothetical protein
LDPKGGGEDRPRPQTLRYFTEYPSLHDASDWCYDCTEEQRKSKAHKERTRSEVRFLGRLNGRKVYDILYYFDDEKEPRWKSLIVQLKRDLYGEVLQVHIVSPTDGVRHSMLVRGENSPLVCVRETLVIGAAVLTPVFGLIPVDQCTWAASSRSRIDAIVSPSAN